MGWRTYGAAEHVIGGATCNTCMMQSDVSWAQHVVHLDASWAQHMVQRDASERTRRVASGCIQMRSGASRCVRFGSPLQLIFCPRKFILVVIPENGLKICLKVGISEARKGEENVASAPKF